MMKRHEAREKQTTSAAKRLVRARLGLRVALGLVSIPVVSLVATSARAGHAFSYTAPVDCPEEPAFLTAVAARGTPIAPTASAADALVVAVTKAESGYEGALRVRHGGGEWTERHVHGESCAEVVDALAVVTAMTLRDTAAPAEVAPVAVVPPPVPAGRPRLRATGDTQSLDVPVDKGTVRFLPAYSLSAYVGGIVGLVPDALVPRYDLVLSRANFVALPGGRTYMTGPILRVRGSFFGPGGHTSSDGYSTTMLGFAFGIHVCGSPLYDTEGFVLLGCAGFSAGLVKLDIESTAGASYGRNVPLASGDFGFEAAYNFSRYVHATVRLETNVTPGGVAPPRPDGSEIFRSSLFTGSGLLGLGAHF